MSVMRIQWPILADVPRDGLPEDLKPRVIAAMELCRDVGLEVDPEVAMFQDPDSGQLVLAIQVSSGEDWLSSDTQGLMRALEASE